MTLPNKAKRGNRVASSVTNTSVVSAEFVLSSVLHKKAMLSTLEMCDKIGFATSPSKPDSSVIDVVSPCEYFKSIHSNTCIVPPFERVSTEVQSINCYCEHQELKEKAAEFEEVYQHHNSIIVQQCKLYKLKVKSVLENQRLYRPVSEAQVETALSNIDKKFATLQIELEEQSLLKLQSLKQSLVSVRIKK
jgi:hypothetical protein